MGDFPSAEEQVAAEEKKQRDLAEERVARREKLGQKAQPEPALGDAAPETPDLPSVGSQLADAQNEDTAESNN